MQSQIKINLIHKLMAMQPSRRNCRFYLLLALLATVSVLLLHYQQQVRYLQLQPQLNKLALIETSASPRTRDLQQLLKCRNRRLELQKLQHGDFWVIENLIAGEVSRYMACAESITYTTNGDYTFFDNLETIAERWRGPISFAVHTPGFDLSTTLDAIQYVRNCLPGSAAIRDYVSFHVYFGQQHMPPVVPLSEAEALRWPINCAEATEMPPPKITMYKTLANLTYPINVGRNIARQAANTHFIFACDIELYPSLGFVQQFLDLVHRNHSVLALEQQKPRVFPLPVFEINANESLPANKPELMALLQAGRAQLFHAQICTVCHRVPGYKSWINQTLKHDAQLKVLDVGQRVGSYRYWEPFYVSDNSEPFFDERVTWEGQSNKRIQGYAMCLLDYEYHVLHPAFLVHTPGIKQFDAKSKRLNYVKAMNRLINYKIKPEYVVLYGTNNNCTT